MSKRKKREARSEFDKKLFDVHRSGLPNDVINAHLRDARKPTQEDCQVLHRLYHKRVRKLEYVINCNVARLIDQLIRLDIENYESQMTEYLIQSSYMTDLGKRLAFDVFKDDYQLIREFRTVCLLSNMKEKDLKAKEDIEKVIREIRKVDFNRQQDPEPLKEDVSLVSEKEWFSEYKPSGSSKK
jgi:hypothetical protein